MLTLRPYQTEAVRIATEYLTRGDGEPSLIVLPTAWGKSVLAAFAARAAEGPVLVVQPSKELLEQNYRKYIMLCGETAPAAIFSASFGKKDVDTVTFATIGSIKELGTQFRDAGFGKMIIDEAHLYPKEEESMLGRFLADSGITQILGITATPLKLEQFNLKEPSGRFDKWARLSMLTEPSQQGMTLFTRILHVGQVQEMTALGFWSPVRYFEARYDIRSLRLNSTGTEFSDDSQKQAYVENQVRLQILDALGWYRDRRHALVFVPSVEEADALAQAVPSAGSVTAATPAKLRRETVEAFREGRIRVLFTVSALATGFDCTKIDLVILARSTASVSLYTQMVGRGVRIDPEKKDCILLDIGGNVRRFGKAEDVFYEQSPATGKWRMYGTGGRLLSGVPVDCIGSFDRQSVIRCETWPNSRRGFPSGRYRGIAFRDVPVGYLRWALRNSGGQDAELDDAIRSAVEGYRLPITTGDPPALYMDTGKYAGTPIQTVPVPYLKWYHGKVKWTVNNDSLRRGIEESIACRTGRPFPERAETKVPPQEQQPEPPEPETPETAQEIIRDIGDTMECDILDERRYVCENPDDCDWEEKMSSEYYNEIRQFLNDMI